MSLALPRQMQSLDVADIGGRVQVFREAQGCEGKPRDEVDLEHRGDELSATLQLSPGTHYLCVIYEAGDYLLGRYVDIEVEVEAGAATHVNLNEEPLQYLDLDDDGDGIANLDELRFGFAIDVVDEDTSARVSLPAVQGFMLGADDDAASVVERPSHTVDVPAFDIDRFEVSRARYRLCVAQGRCAAPGGVSALDYLSEQDPALLSLPAVAVTRAEAETFCRDVAHGSLPTEAQWEYAARPGETVYPWGDLPLADGRERCDRINARYFEGDRDLGVSAPCLSDELGRIRLRAVDYFSASGPGRDEACARLPGSTVPDGPCQMAGNVWEWTSSDLRPYPGASWTAAASAPAVIRGGSADSLDQSLRSTFRAGVAPDLGDQSALQRLVGFRCVYAP